MDKPLELEIDESKSGLKKVILRKPSEKQRIRGLCVKAKKKTAVARAIIKKGTGKVTVNHRALAIIDPEYIKMLISEPLRLADQLSKEVDIAVSVSGSGPVSQAVSVRAAIAKALLQYSADKLLKQKFMLYDKMLLVDDPRRKESKKPLGRGARAKKQLSKR
ncbi:MAG: 30S ribosomal protein S9 [Candidatus Diapherotrites archaeon CG08_land_8_20_14_0_20_34_12]|nr:MAG: 30S ribosomal protein S9 [Candidatus Diapherotrites archaeon CG08_land_8_20_14_0_20_34_12]